MDLFKYARMKKKITIWNLYFTEIVNKYKVVVVYMENKWIHFIWDTQTLVSTNSPSPKVTYTSSASY